MTMYQGKERVGLPEESRYAIWTISQAQGRHFINPRPARLIFLCYAPNVAIP